MKYLKFVSLILLGLFLIDCNDNPTEVIQKVDQNSANNDGVLRKECANYTFPDTMEATTLFGLECGGEEEDIAGSFVAILWSNLVVGENDSLGNLGCEPHPFFDAPPPVNNFQNITGAGNHPKFSWEFRFSHYFDVQKRINGGGWSTIYSIHHTHDSTRTYYYEDTSVNLSSLQGILEYRVRNRLFYGLNENSEASDTTFTFYGDPVPISVSIDGPYEVFIPTKGQPPVTKTWYADTDGGVAPLTYDWYYNSNHISSNSYVSYSFPYSPGTDGYFTLKLVVHDSYSSSDSSSIQVFQDFPPYQP
jgi:hypothetical protein